MVIQMTHLDFSPLLPLSYVVVGENFVKNLVLSAQRVRPPPNPELWAFLPPRLVFVMLLIREHS